MTSRTGQVLSGLGMMGAGGAGLAIGLFQPTLLPERILGLPSVVLADAAGATLVLLGVVVFARSLRAAPAPPTVVPAHVAFVNRAPRAVATPEPPAKPVPRPAAGRAPRRAESAEMTKIDEEIRELTRRINKAGVMLATGQISRQGYASYVDELKTRRGALEASRVRLELHHE